MTAQLVRSESAPRPGGTVTYAVWIWSTVKSDQVTASVSTAGRAMYAPVFDLCPSRHRATCSLGQLPAYQAFEILVTDKIGNRASPGEQITMTVEVEGVAQTSPGGPLSPAEAAVGAILSQPNASPSVPITDTVPPATGSGLSGTTVTPGSITSLFPVVTPSPTPVASASRRHGRSRVTKATSTASSLPLDPRLIGGQVAGLAVLAAAVTMVVARLSLRTPQPAVPQGPAAPAGPNAPTAPPPEPADAKDDAAAHASAPGTPEQPTA